MKVFPNVDRVIELFSILGQRADKMGFIGGGIGYIVFINNVFKHSDYKHVCG